MYCADSALSEAIQQHVEYEFYEVAAAVLRIGGPQSFTCLSRRPMESHNMFSFHL